MRKTALPSVYEHKNFMVVENKNKEKQPVITNDKICKISKEQLEHFKEEVKRGLESDKTFIEKCLKNVIHTRGKANYESSTKVSDVRHKGKYSNSDIDTVKYKLVLSPEQQGMLISLGVVALGNIIKPKQRDVGNFVQGIGLGTGIGTIIHRIDQEHPSATPHHDVVALASIPVTFILDKTNVIENKDAANNLYGIGLGVLAEHLICEGCSICDKAYYCRNGEKLC